MKRDYTTPSIDLMAVDIEQGIAVSEISTIANESFVNQEAMEW